MSLSLCSVAQADRGVVGHFGGEGSGDGQISYGTGIDVYSATGDVYVSDTFNNRVERFDADGNFELAFGWGVGDGSEEFQVCTSGCQEGLPGSGAGQFAGPYQGPRTIAVDQSDGSVYVLDPGNARIEKFDAGGNFLRAFGWGVLDGSNELQACTAACQAGSYGSGAGQIGEGLYEAGMAVDPTSGDLLITDYLYQRVQEYDASGAFVRTFGGDVEEGGGEGFEVCEEAAKCKAGVEGSEPGMFSGYQPHGIGIDSDGTIYVTEGSRGNVQKFSPSGGTLTPSVFVNVEGPMTLTVDRSTHHVVVIYMDASMSYNSRAAELDASGNVVDHYLGGLRYSIPGIAFNEATGRGYALSKEHFVFIVDQLARPEVTVEAASEVTATTATLNGTVNSQGEPATTYRFEYSLDGSGEWTATTTGTVPGDLSDHHVSAQVSPPAGLEPNSLYRFRLVAEKPENEEVVSAEETFTTPGTPPLVETVGSPFRTATTARLDSRVNARGQATTYRFEWGITSSYGNIAPASAEAAAGSGQRSILFSEQLTGLAPGTTYHYRVVATNASGTTVGDDMTVTTRGSDQPLIHGHFPGPPGSDRAYEQVNLPNTGGNPVFAGYAFSDDGNRAVYQVTGGTPQSDNGTLLNQFFAERGPNGWVTSSIWPTRAAAGGSSWSEPAANRDLTKLMAQNYSPGASPWILTPGAAPQKLIDVPDENAGGFAAASDDLSRIVLRLKGSPDPANPVSNGAGQLYDVSAGTPHLISFLPDGTIPSCGVPIEGTSYNLPIRGPLRESHMIAANGSSIVFPSVGNDPDCELGDRQLYLRDIVADKTLLISPPPVSGPECSAAFIKASDDSVFFWSQSRLSPEDDEPTPGNCTTYQPSGQDGDVYRYDLAGGGVSCLTCSIGKADVIADPNGTGVSGAIAIAADGSRIYFSSRQRLVPGEGYVGTDSIYRLDVASGELKFVSPGGATPPYGIPGDLASYGQAITRDGSVIVFRSDAANMNAITNSDNGGRLQYYRYDDRDGSLVCASCPRDGSPAGELGIPLAQGQYGPNTTLLSDSGDLVFITSAPLVGADQNTSKPGEFPALGNDVYEWRDGRVLLVTDGKTSWPGATFSPPGVAGITPSGHDVYFTAAAQLTPDAIDGFKRLYDARIGGGFEFPQPEPPCPLEICQGEAKGAPNHLMPASSGFHGAGNVKQTTKHRRHRKCHRGKKKRCARKHPKKHTSKNGRAH